MKTIINYSNTREVPFSSSELSNTKSPKVPIVSPNPSIIKILNSLIKNYNHKIIYLTSDINDKLLKSKDNNFKTYYIGTGIFRTIFFSTLNVKFLVSTLPDLNNFHIKRSKYKSL